MIQKDREGRLLAFFYNLTYIGIADSYFFSGHGDVELRIGIIGLDKFVDLRDISIGIVIQIF